MSKNDYITPINHTGASAFGAEAAGTAGGAIKGGLATAALWIGAAALIGLGIGLMVSSGGAAAPGVGGLFSTAWSFITSAPGIGLIIGGIVGTTTSVIPSTIGAVVGGFGGHSKASNRVSQERAAAMQLQAEISAGQAPAQQINVGYPAQGSRFNPAMSSIQADSAMADGRVNGDRALQLA